MQIFIIDKDPVQAARVQCDKHVVKMPLECAQMLCTALHQYDVADIPYKTSHARHPCTLWVTGSRSNFFWLVVHGLVLCSEYTIRYKRLHKSQEVIEWCMSKAHHIPEGALTEPPQAVPDEFKRDNVITAYRAYYHSKVSFAKWKRNKPTWWQGESYEEETNGQEFS
tara:strand:- start:8212 stop:8712 length:501 start_codon:yes stop_codon:yes gene_type:complete